jgi:hypothetical protein
LDSFVPNWSSVELALDHDPRSAFLGDYVYTLVAAFSRNTRAPSRPVQFLGAEVFEFCWSHLAREFARWLTLYCPGNPRLNEIGDRLLIALKRQAFIHGEGWFNLLRDEAILLRFPLVHLRISVRILPNKLCPPYGQGAQVPLYGGVCLLDKGVLRSDAP